LYNPIKWRALYVFSKCASKLLPNEETQGPAVQRRTIIVCRKLNCTVLLPTFKALTVFMTAKVKFSRGIVETLNHRGWQLCSNKTFPKC